jgi:hypothetical protein
MHIYDGVLPGATKESLATLLSPPQCYASFDTMPHNLASVDQSPVCCPRTLPPSALNFGGVSFRKADPSGRAV